MANCDEFIYYDDLVREQKPRRAARKKSAASEPAPAPGGGNGEDKKKEEDRHQEAFDLVLATFEALLAERGEDEKVWGSMVKQALKRRRPGFNESYYGFRSFNRLLEEAAARHLLALERDEKSGGYIVRSTADRTDFPQG
jgi:hypothetical protein